MKQQSSQHIPEHHPTGEIQEQRSYLVEALGNLGLGGSEMTTMHAESRASTDYVQKVLTEYVEDAPSAKAADRRRRVKERELEREARRFKADREAALADSK